MRKNPGKRIGFMLIVFLLFSCFCTSVRGDTPDQEISGKFFEILLADGRKEYDPVSGEISGEQIRFFTLSDNKHFGFVVPGDWDASRLRIFFCGMESITIDNTDHKSGDLIALPLNEEVPVKIPGEDEITIEIRRTGSLPVLFVHTESGSSDAINADKTVREPGNLLMTDADGETVYEGSLSAVKARGNATFTYEKKPYQIKLEKGTALAGSGEAKTWVLLANVIDRSQIRCKLAFDLARYTGAFSYTPYSQSVDLYMNCDYMGTYLLTEKAQVQKNRLKITNLEKTVEDMNPELDFAGLNAQGDPEYRFGARKYFEIPEEPEDISGGYLFQINIPLRYATESSAFVTTRGCVFTSQEPKYLSEAQTDYIASLLQQIEDALFSEDGVDPVSGKYYTEFLDLSSFVNRYLMAEVLDDYDGQYTYFYKDSDAVDPAVYAGPVWDQDNILGVWLPQSDPSVIHIIREEQMYNEWSWYKQAARHSDFMEAVKDAYFRTYRPALQILLGEETDQQGVLRSVDDYAGQVRISAETDFWRWPFPTTDLIRYNLETGNSFEKQITFLKEYLTARLHALDEFFQQFE